MSKLKNILAAEGLLKSASLPPGLSQAVKDAGMWHADIKGHRWLQPFEQESEGIAKARSDIMSALDAYRNELEKFHGQEEARLKALADTQRAEAERVQAKEIKQLGSQIERALLRLGGSGGPEGRNRWAVFLPNVSKSAGLKMLKPLAAKIANSIPNDGGDVRIDKESGSSLMVQWTKNQKPWLRIYGLVWASKDSRNSDLKISVALGTDPNELVRLL